MKFLIVFSMALFALNAAQAHYHEHQDYHTAPQYRFEYGVQDQNTQDVKTQFEQRDRDNVRGAYALQEPDGTQRIVEYTAGPHTGFQALVRRIGNAQHQSQFGNFGQRLGGFGQGSGQYSQGGQGFQSLGQGFGQGGQGFGNLGQGGQGFGNLGQGGQGFRNLGQGGNGGSSYVGTTLWGHGSGK